MKNTTLLAGIIIIAALGLTFVLPTMIENTQKERTLTEIEICENELNNMMTPMEAEHFKRFEAFMEKYDVPYTDSGCEFGEQMTKIPYTANFTVEYAAELMDTIPQDIFDTYFSSFND